MRSIHAMYELEESYAVYYMELQGVDQADLLQEMTIIYDEVNQGRRTNFLYEERAHFDEGVGSPTIVFPLL